MERNTFYVPDIQKCSKQGNIFSLDKKIWEKIQKYGHDGTLLQKSVLAKKLASTALSTDHRRARNTHDIKTFHRKLYRHNDISLLEHFLTFFKYNFFNNIFFCIYAV